MRDRGLQSTPFTLSKVLQLYETKNSHHSTMIVGCTGSGKTTSWRILQASLSSLCRAGEPNFNMVRVRTGDGDAPAPGQRPGLRTVQARRAGQGPGRDGRPEGKSRRLATKGATWAEAEISVCLLGLPLEPEGVVPGGAVRRV